MILPASYSFFILSFATKMIATITRCRPPLNSRPLGGHNGEITYKVESETKTLIKRFNESQRTQTPSVYRNGYKYMDMISLNGGYVPSYMERPASDKKFVPMENWRWYVESKEGTGGSVRQSGGGIGRLDAANEDGFFFRVNKSRLKKLKEILKQKGKLGDKGIKQDKKS